MGWDQDVVLFDGGCAFCDDAVRFVIAHDRRGRFRYAPNCSTIGRTLRARHGVDDRGGLLLIADGQAHSGSSAPLRIARRLGWRWSWLSALLAVPRPVRDALYRCFAHRAHPRITPMVAMTTGNGATG